ncbi:MAG: substrate-binding domain-containing protein [Chloroflexota bacterium]
MSSRLFRPAALLAVLILAAACGGSGATQAPSTGAPSTAAPSTASLGAPTTAPTGAGVSGEIFVTGSSTVAPISLALSEDFKALNPNFGYTVEGPGTGDGFALFCGGEADVADASRAIKDTEATECTDAAVEYTELKVAYDGITVMTHPDTPIDCLTTADLYALFGPESDNVANWQDAQTLATDLGSSAQFPDLALQITAPGEESGTYDAFVELGGITATAADRGKEEGVLRLPGPNYTASPNDNVIVEGVEAGAGSLGFVGFAYFEHAGDAVKAIAIDAGEGCIDPTIETIADGTYPLSRPLFIYVNNQKATDNAALAAWVDFYLSDAGIQNVVDAGYVALPADELDATRQAWANR